MQAILWPIVSWIFREILIKFVLLTGMIFMIGMVVPMAVQYLGAHIGTSGLTGAFSALPAGIWYFLDYFRVDMAVPLLISASVARFLIRRLPFIG